VLKVLTALTVLDKEKGQTLATVIMLETGTIDRFANAGNFASYARCVDSQRMSNGKK